MQYFAGPNRGTKTKLLFYLVTEVFAQSLSRFSRDEICDRVEDGEGDAVEHVLAYSGAIPQVPYNQHLGLGSDRRYQRRAIRRVRFSRHGGAEREK
jgi:hypothetical protein